MKKKEREMQVLYDYLKVNGGAEAVFHSILDTLGKSANGVVDFISKGYPLISNAQPPIRTLQKREYRVGSFSHFFTPWKFYRFTPASSNEVIFSSGLYAIFSSMNVTAQTLRIYYCHTPPRHWYDLRSFYSKNTSLFVRVALSLQELLFKSRYELACSRQHLIIANSVHVKNRIEKYLGLDSVVIYPPCNIKKYDWLGQGDYYLSTSRLEPYKRVKLIVEAFTRMPHKKLIVASGGSQLSELIKLAKGHANISFTGWCDEQKLISLIGNCIATIYMPIAEDFGISPVESMAAGKPVIGVQEGGVIETVIDGETGVLCPSDPSVENVIDAVASLGKDVALTMRESCVSRAQRFSEKVFTDKISLLSQADSTSIKDVAKKVDAS
ncbi:glycosyltransferase [Pseudoalteromonas sp. CO325X]|uniref:glycosyltransferase n=1 Tax=Pseudoalteromonas sp. CO325X TaxID=1777262 RepID=UPI001023ED59|nr:glycosyltransferase [Pseudoalteromonas sp. CO325X]RZF79195.1 glycosyltransferase [Pseudoalteromonas sp. CO325X]